MAKYTAAQKARDIFNDLVKNGYCLEFISGKWFYTKLGKTWGEEIPDIKRFLLQTYPHIFDDISDIERTLDVYIAMYGSTRRWYDGRLVHEAKEKCLAGDHGGELCFPLNDMQLKIINRLIVGEDEKMFIVTGCGGSGKSTFLNIIKQIFENDVSACPLSELSGYNLSEALSRRLIASDEISADDLDNKAIKMIISKQNMQLNPKFGKPYQISCQSGLFYCCNIPPRIDLSDTGLLRRIVYYEMDVPIKNPDMALRQKQWGERDIVNIIQRALSMDMTNWEEEFKEKTRYYLLKNNSVYILRQYNNYQDYVCYSNKKGLRPYSEPKWSEVRALIKEWKMIGDNDADYKPLDPGEELPF